VENKFQKRASCGLIEIRNGGFNYPTLAFRQNSTHKSTAKAGINCHRLLGGSKLVSSVGTRLHRQYGIILYPLCVNKQIVKWLIPN